ncbi:DNA/RNA non-specific endonuclease [Acidovorax sp. LjRoot66]|uniref:DNA/RNA non-specific endonuclease n=1 Tax=Acidovorax sp. LjRoot66 TaxID=3342334 RepID=UPI003ED0523A
MNLLFSWPRAARGATALALVLGAAAPSLARTPSTFLDSIAGLRSAQPTGFVHCPQFFVGGKPPPVPRRTQQRQLCYEAFAVLHSGETRTPVYVAQRLNRQVLEGADEKRSNKFFADARLPRGERAELDDYKRSGYSRGHMAPAADMSTPTAMAQSFSLANMVPQDPRQNGGPWARIEQDTRRYVLRARGDVYVITGPVFTAESPAIGASKVRVPAYLFKLVYDASTQRAWAHWQANREGERAGPPISYQELVKRTGVEFLPQVEPQH